jgi:hypothetical protein
LQKVFGSEASQSKLFDYILKQAPFKADAEYQMILPLPSVFREFSSPHSAIDSWGAEGRQLIIAQARAKCGQ